MEYKEAYEILIEAWQGDKTKPNHPNFDDINEALGKIKELVNKATPMLVNDIHIDEFYCPKCHSEITHDISNIYHPQYCEECGQRLDWGNYNGN